MNSHDVVGTIFLDMTGSPGITRPEEFDGPQSICKASH
jgi:hypothetical protein